MIEKLFILFLESNEYEMELIFQTKNYFFFFFFDKPNKELLLHANDAIFMNIFGVCIEY